jgi:cyclase
MKKFRIIPRLDVKNNTIVKGIHLEGLRVVGSPGELAQRYYEESADELLYIDAVASLYDRNSLTDIIRMAAQKIFIPLTVCGGIRKVQDITDLLNSGADKVAINTAAVRNPSFLKEAVARFGSQCIVLSVEAKQTGERRWEAYTETGRERSGRDAVEWVREAIDLGVGEVLLTSVDRDGTKRGYDLALIEKVAAICTGVPLIVCGGAGAPEHVVEAARCPGVDALALGTLLHYELFSLLEIKRVLDAAEIRVRL